MCTYLLVSMYNYCLTYYCRVVLYIFSLKFVFMIVYNCVSLFTNLFNFVLCIYLF